MDENLQDKVNLYDTGLFAEPKVFFFNDVLYSYLVGQSEIQRFTGKEKLKPFDIPERVGKVHTICDTNVLLISGDKGFVVYDQNFKILYELTVKHQLKSRVLYAN